MKKWCACFVWIIGHAPRLTVLKNKSGAREYMYCNRSRVRRQVLREFRSILFCPYTCWLLTMKSIHIIAMFPCTAQAGVRIPDTLSQFLTNNGACPSSFYISHIRRSLQKRMWRVNSFSSSREFFNHSRKTCTLVKLILVETRVDSRARICNWHDRKMYNYTIKKISANIHTWALCTPSNGH